VFDALPLTDSEGRCVANLFEPREKTQTARRSASSEPFARSATSSPNAAQARGDAERLEARLKQRKAILTLKHRKEAGSAAMAETMALADREYELALSEYETARIKHLLADADAEKAKLSFEAWRTASSNRRAEMSLR
jgi:hypothetical protein